MPWVGLQCVIVVFPDHTHLRFGKPSLPDPFQNISNRYMFNREDYALDIFRQAARLVIIYREY